MSSTLAFYWSFGGTVDGVNVTGEHTSMTEPVKLHTIDGTYSLFRAIVIPVTTAAHPYPDPTLVWDWEDAGDTISLLAFQIAGGAGYVRLAWMVDAPTSTSDPTPSGSSEVWNSVDLSCTMPFILSTEGAGVNTTLASAVSVDGDGFPAILTDAATETGRLYSVWARNLSTTDAVTLYVWMRS